MSAIVKFTEAASMAIHTMAFLASVKGRVASVAEVASRLAVSEHHLAKVLQRLVRAGLASSVRGAGGGFTFKGDPAKITLLQVYEAIEGRAQIEGCLFSPPKCTGACVLGDVVRDANALIHDRLARTRLTDVVHVFTTVRELARLRPPEERAPR